MSNYGSKIELCFMFILNIAASKPHASSRQVKRLSRESTNPIRAIETFSLTRGVIRLNGRMEMKRV